MSLTNIKTKLQTQEGFTIVELLIVIVVIAILAAITIVSYNGITARANTTSAQSAASTVVKKSEAYYADASTSGYPTTNAAIGAAAAASYPYGVTGVTFKAGTFTNAATTASAGLPTSPSQVMFISCGATIGNKIGYWDYSANAIVYLYSGTATASNCTSTTGI